MILRDAIIGGLVVLLAYVFPNKWYKLLVLLIIAAKAISLFVSWTSYLFLRKIVLRYSFKRRDKIRENVARDQEAYDERKRLSPKSEDDGWEKVQGTDSRPSKSPVLDGGYDGFIGFFHPFANAGGGGERVLWAAIKATQDRWPKAVCVVYTGDHQSGKSTILERVKSRFDIDLHAPTIVFLYLGKRAWVVASSYPRFTLLRQSLGSIVVAHEALSLLTPDIFIDTMGYSFSTWYCKFLFPHISIGSYVHYPFIGTHMVESLVADYGQGINVGSGKGAKGFGKKMYWKVLLKLYTWTGTSIDAVMTNSSWTQAHMQRIWGEGRKSLEKPPAEVVYPPCSVEEIIDQIPQEGQHATPRDPILLCIAQFRPEKNHELLIQAFAEMTRTSATEDARLVLIGSVRDSEDETLVYKLRLLAKELKVDDKVDFRINSTWGEILEYLKISSVGVNGMWCEHFGIGVVEYQAAGLICVVNDSGGPKEDIVVEYDGGSTGYHASTASQYAEHFATALTLPPASTTQMRARNRASSKRFTTDIFAEQWSRHLSSLIAISQRCK